MSEIPHIIKDDYQQRNPKEQPVSDSRTTPADATSLVTSSERLHEAIGVFLKDLADGDFALPRLAEIHVENIREKYRDVGKALTSGEEAYNRFMAAMPPTTTMRGVLVTDPTAKNLAGMLSSSEEECSALRSRLATAEANAHPSHEVCWKTHADLRQQLAEAKGENAEIVGVRIVRALEAAGYISMSPGWMPTVCENYRERISAIITKHLPPAPSAEEVRALREDKKRLDWLESGDSYLPTNQHGVRKLGFLWDENESMRSAIDAAIAARSPQQGGGT